jgi:beta-lactamase regulating signal transducer with metallopeptidase domain/ketosteroid isomerase-like protein
MNELINSCITAINDVGGGFCHFAGSMFVQSSVLIVAFLIIDRLMRKRVRAVFRYWIWMLVFIKLILPPTLSLPTGVGNWLGDYFSAGSVVTQHQSDFIQGEALNEPAPVEAADSAVLPQIQPPAPEIASEPVVPSVSEAPMTTETPMITIASDVSAAPTLTALTWQGVVFLLWLVGVLVITVLLIQRIIFVKGLIAQSEPAKNRLVDVLENCRRQVGVRRNIRLRLSPNVTSPAVCGLFNPVILIPKTLLEQLSQEKLRAVLIHELAHIKRGDLWINCIQTFLQIAYFYNPFVWLANMIVRRIREQAVDEMVLVALGAEAKNYSNTLIDIAEMAFSRPALSLRLVGVVESKKALSERIKHILSRPIPKTARLGILSLLTIIVIAAVLLPMAKAAKQENAVAQKPAPKQFIAALPNGVTVELLGVCEHLSEGKQWWLPDGSPKENEPYDKIENPELQYLFIGSRSGGHRREFALRLNGINDNSINMRWRVLPSNGSLLDEKPLRDNKPVKDMKAIVASIPIENDRVRIDIGVSSGDWKTVAGGAPDRDNSFSTLDGRGSFSNINERNGKTVLTVADSFTDFDYNVIAVDNNDGIHTPANMSPVLSSARLTTVTFDNLPLETIKEFQLQIRPYEWVTFNNVSLEQGILTDVQINVEGADIEAGNPKSVKVLTESDKMNLYSMFMAIGTNCESIESAINSGDIRTARDFSELIAEISPKMQTLAKETEFETIVSAGVKHFDLFYQAIKDGNIENAKAYLKTLQQLGNNSSRMFQGLIENKTELKSTSSIDKQGKIKIILQANVFSVNAPQSLIMDYMRDELGINITATDVTNVTEAQAKQFKKWITTLPDTTVISSPSAVVADGQQADLSVTNQNEFIVDYEKTSDSPPQYKPKRQKFTTGVELELTPTLMQDNRTVNLTVRINKTDLGEVQEKTHESGKTIQLPVRTNSEIMTQIAIPVGKYFLVSTAGMYPSENGIKPNQQTKQTILLIKADLLNEQSRGAGNEIPPAMVGTWFFDNPMGDDEQMAIFPDGRVVVLYSNGHKDQTRYENGSIELAEYKNVRFRLSLLNDTTLIEYSESGDGGLAKRWQCIDAQPQTNLLRPLTGQNNSQTDTSAGIGSQADEQILKQLEEMTQERIRAFNDKDVDKMLSYFADNAIVLPDQHEIAIGKGAIRNLYLENTKDSTKINSVESLEQKLWICDNFIFEAGKVKVSFTTPASQYQLNDWQTYTAVRSRQPDGSLKTLLDSGNSVPIPEDGNVSVPAKPVIIEIASGTKPADKNMEAIYGQIRQYESTFHKAFIDRNVETATEFYADDAILMPWRQNTLKGKREITEFISKDMEKSPLVTMTQNVLHVEGNNEMLYLVNLFTWTFKDSTSGQDVTFPGKGVHVWMRQKDGSWKILLDLNNVNIPINAN